MDYEIRIAVPKTVFALSHESYGAGGAQIMSRQAELEKAFAKQAQHEDD